MRNFFKAVTSVELTHIPCTNGVRLRQISLYNDLYNLEQTQDETEMTHEEKKFTENPILKCRVIQSPLMGYFQKKFVDTNYSDHGHFTTFSFFWIDSCDNNFHVSYNRNISSRNHILYFKFMKKDEKTY